MEGINEELKLKLKQLKKRIRSHNYYQSPVIAEYLNQRRASDRDITVYERRTSESAQNGEELDGNNNDTHSTCLAPVLNNRQYIECCICLFPAINPFRCTKPDGSENIENFNEEYSNVYHICCYQCIAKLMITQISDSISCPMCRNNTFILDKLIPVSNAIMYAAQDLIFHCENDCGLMGNAIALSQHICPLNDPKKIGHTAQSIAVQVLQKEIDFLKNQNEKMAEEVSHVLRNYEIKKREEIELKSQISCFIELSDDKDKNIKDKEKTIDNLQTSVKVKDDSIRKLDKEYKETIQRCKGKLKYVKKFYETKEQAVRHQYELVIEGLKKIAVNPLAFDAVVSQITDMREKSIEIRGKADNAKSTDASQTSRATVFFKNTAYRLPPYDRESLSIIEFKKMIKNVIPNLDENEYELCRLTYTMIRDNEDSNRCSYSSAVKPKPLKTVVLSDNPNFIYLPKRLTASHDDSIAISFSCPIVTDEPIMSASAQVFSDSENNSE